MKKILGKSKIGIGFNVANGIFDIASGDKTVKEASGDVAVATAKTVATGAAASALAGTSAGVAATSALGATAVGATAVGALAIGLAPLAIVGAGIWGIKKLFSD